MDPVSIVIVDDHPAVVDGVRAGVPLPTGRSWSSDRGPARGGGLRGRATADVVLFDLQLETGVLSSTPSPSSWRRAGAWS